MISRQRVLRHFARQPVGRPPLDGSFSPGIWNRLKRHFGTSSDDEVRRWLGLDFRTVIMDPGPAFREGASLLEAYGMGLFEGDLVVRKAGGGIYENEWGMRIQVDEFSHSWGYVHHPLERSLSLAGLKIPDLRAPGRFDRAQKEIEAWKEDYFVAAGVSTLFRKGWLLCGFTRFLEALLLERPFVEDLLDRLMEFTLREIETFVRLGVDMIQLLGDLGTEQSLFLSPSLWREIFKPRMRALIQETRREGVYYFLHSDGNIGQIIPDLVEIGIEILNPIQPECLDPVEIKRLYGNKLILHGTISCQRTLPSGKPEDVRKEVVERIEQCGYDGGLVVAPANAITEDVPLGNVLALYEAVQELDG
jgi:uroporphyrinogen decarboxylase